ncbi:uncharacterized protein MKK02DRAFT_31957 [Dioszegia hungarica]|uniref:Uncharacterized protein n=1 Tax=Dioszegia hungarica TaxID=4972 RepID=A0AA38LXE5_9TREE|nr:uncharacterized protein MKK02DRAFT_31957 [Dioszegia hungarica]KAI9638533.1 hypothetical protein MKK02DRAFT_31957 [Dioszegia hungarica]
MSGDPSQDPTALELGGWLHDNRDRLSSDVATVLKRITNASRNWTPGIVSVVSVFMTANLTVFVVATEEVTKEELGKVLVETGVSFALSVGALAAMIKDFGNKSTRKVLGTASAIAGAAGLAAFFLAPEVLEKMGLSASAVGPTIALTSGFQVRLYEWFEDRGTVRSSATRKERRLGPLLDDPGCACPPWPGTNVERTEKSSY